MWPTLCRPLKTPSSRRESSMIYITHTAIMDCLHLHFNCKLHSVHLATLLQCASHSFQRDGWAPDSLIYKCAHHTISKAKCVIYEAGSNMCS